MAKLYEMTAATACLYDMLMAEEIDEKTFQDTVEAMGAIEKVEGYCQIITELGAESSKFKAEIDRLTARKRTIDNRIKWLKEQLTQFYNVNGAEKIKAGTFTVSMRMSEYVDIPDVTKIPKKYLKVKTEPDKTAIKEALSKGVKVRGASIATRGSVQIR